VAVRSKTRSLWIRYRPIAAVWRLCCVAGAPGGAAGGTRQGFGLRRSALRADCAAMLRPGRPRGNSLRCALAQTLPGESDVDARCARSARVFRFSPTPTHPWRVPPAALSTGSCAPPGGMPPLLFQSWPGVAGDARGRRRAAQGLRPARATRAPRKLTRRALNAVSEANEVNCTPGRKTEQHSAVGPQGRPPRSRGTGHPGPALPLRPQRSNTAAKRPQWAANRLSPN